MRRRHLGGAAGAFDHNPIALPALAVGLGVPASVVRSFRCVDAAPLAGILT